MKLVSSHFRLMYDRISLGIFRFIFRSILLVLILILLIPNVVMPLLARPLLRLDHPERHADAVIVLGGDPVVRAAPAVRAVFDGFGSKLMMIDCQGNHLEDAGLIPSEATLMLQIAQKSGLDRGKINILTMNGKATSTADEAKAYRDYFTAHPPEAKRLVVVTSWPHSSRAGWILDKALAPLGIKVEMIPVERVPFSYEDWWKSEEGMIFIFEEYIKWGRYLAKYAGRSLPE